MPSINITERDLSWYYRQREPGQVVVCMPGVSTFGPYDPVLVNQENFAMTLGEKAVDSKDISYEMAKSFVKSGVSVLFIRQPLEGARAANCSFATGATQEEPSVTVMKVFAHYDGSFGTGLLVKMKKVNDGYRTFVYRDNNLIENFTVSLTDPSSKYYWKVLNNDINYIQFDVFDETRVSEVEESFLNPNGFSLGGGTNGTFNVTNIVNSLKSADLSILKDRLAYFFNIIIDGGFNAYSLKGEQYEASDIDKKLLNIAEERGSAFYIIDGPGPLTGIDYWDADDYYAYTQQSEFNSSYAACFGGPVIASLASNGVSRELPASYAFIRSWAESLAAGNPIYYAPAGVKRASLNFVSSTTMDVTSAVIDMWQNQEDIVSSDGHKINPITRLRQYGYVIYGNSTLLQNKEDGSTSMLQSLSVRIMCNLIKEQAFLISLGLQFDQIDNDLFMEFRTLLAMFMDQLRYGGALYDYEIVADYSELTLDDINNRTVPVLIRISPNPAAEKFDIVLEISQAGVTFGADTDVTTTEA